MSVLTSLDIKCLNNIPMLLDVINASTDSLVDVLGECRNEIQKEVDNNLTDKKWKCDLKDEYIVDWAQISLSRTLRIQKGKKAVCEISCSYSSSEDNRIFFQLTEEDGFSLMTEDFKGSVEIDTSFIKVCNAEDDNDFISVELPVTQDLSENQIDDCMVEFIDKVLRPYLDLLLSTF